MTLFPFPLSKAIKASLVVGLQRILSARVVSLHPPKNAFSRVIGIASLPPSVVAEQAAAPSGDVQRRDGATRVIHKRPLGGSWWPRLRSHVDNPLNGLRLHEAKGGESS